MEHKIQMRINQRELEKFKNHLFRKFRLDNCISGRIKTHNQDDKSFLKYQKFYKKWATFKKSYTHGVIEGKLANDLFVFSNPTVFNKTYQEIFCQII